MKTLICNCNGTMALDGPALVRALSASPNPAASAPTTPGPADLAVHTGLCRREAPAFQRAAKLGKDTGQGGGADDLLVACTQERRLFLELAQQTEGVPRLDERPIRFVNIRETALWSSEGKSATPKVAALLAAAALPDPEPVPAVSYRSSGRCLIIAAAGGAPAAERAAQLLGGGIDASLLVDGGALGQAHEREVHRGRLTALSGHLGAFEARWTSNNPIDLDVCTRCNACIRACPEGAIDFGYQIDLERCRSHRDCVAACDAAGAIDFQRAPLEGGGRFDLVLDQRDEPAFLQHAPPQGYRHVGGASRTRGTDPQTPAARSDAQLIDAVLELRERVGEFEKPRFFRYKPKLCAHSRNEQIGCTACIDVCSAKAVKSEASLKGRAGGKIHRPAAPVRPDAGGQGGGIAVDPYLCVGCGACTTVCPSGALSYATPGPEDMGRRLRTLLQTYARAGGRDAALLLHSQGAGQRRIEALGRAAAAGLVPGGSTAARVLPLPPGGGVRGLPARALPVPLWHTASVGLDLWLLAIAQGANQVIVLLTDEEAPDYRRALAEQMAIGQAVLTGLGYAGTHLRLVDGGAGVSLVALDEALRASPAQGVARTAAVVAQADKRNTLDLALDHLMAVAPKAVPDSIALPAAGTPWGSLRIDNERCTLCLSCVGACPESALADNPDRPQLRFIERSCVQCGLCVSTCPEDALALEPRLWLADGGRARKAARVLHEAEPFHCVGCGKPFGTARAIEAMIAKVGNHPAFEGDGARRLKLCSDCRVVAMFSNPNEVKIGDIR